MKMLDSRLSTIVGLFAAAVVADKLKEAVEVRSRAGPVRLVAASDPGLKARAGAGR